MTQSRIWRALTVVPDSASTGIGAQRRSRTCATCCDDRALRLQPVREAGVADARHHRGDQMPARRAERHRLAGRRRLRAEPRQRVVAGAMVGHLADPRGEHGAVDLAKAPALVLHAGLRRRHEDERRRLGRERHQRRRSRSRRARTHSAATMRPWRHREFCFGSCAPFGLPRRSNAPPAMAAQRDHRVASTARPFSGWVGRAFIG